MTDTSVRPHSSNGHTPKPGPFDEVSERLATPEEALALALISDCGGEALRAISRVRARLIEHIAAELIGLECQVEDMNKRLLERFTAKGEADAAAQKHAGDDLATLALGELYEDVWALLDRQPDGASGLLSAAIRAVREYSHRLRAHQHLTF